MTAAEPEANPDPVWAFLRALPYRTRRELNATARLVMAVHAAVDEHGWTPSQLAEHCARNLTARNVGGVIQHRLDAIDGPPANEGESPFGRKLPFCSPDCRDRAGWIEDEDGRPISRCECRTTNRPTEDNT